MRTVSLLHQQKRGPFQDPLKEAKWRESGKALLGVVPRIGTDHGKSRERVESRDGHCLRPLLLLSYCAFARPNFWTLRQTHGSVLKSILYQQLTSDHTVQRKNVPQVLSVFQR